MNRLWMGTYLLTWPASILTPFTLASTPFALNPLLQQKSFSTPATLQWKSVTGIAAGLEIAGEGTFVFQVEDDDGRIDTIEIPHSFYVPGLKLPLLFPQHWAETAKENDPIKYRTKIQADKDGYTLLW